MWVGIVLWWWVVGWWVGGCRSLWFLFGGFLGEIRGALGRADGWVWWGRWGVGFLGCFRADGWVLTLPNGAGAGWGRA